MRICNEVDYEFGGHAVPHDCCLGDANKPEASVTDRKPNPERANADTAVKIGPRYLLIKFDVLAVFGTREPHLPEGYRSGGGR